MPDVFVWVVSSGKRTAYQRIQARDLIYSPVDEECGRDCGRVQTLFLKVIMKTIFLLNMSKQHFTYTFSTKKYITFVVNIMTRVQSG
jgi:hypothetical protein